MSTTTPIVRSTRRRDLDAAVGQVVFTLDRGPVYDLADIQVFWRLTDTETRWTRLNTGFALAFVDSQTVTATFTTAPRAAAGDPKRTVRIQSARVQERVTNATRGGAVQSAALETDLDRIATVLQEVRRDIDEIDGSAALAAAAEAKVSATSAATSATAAANSAATAQTFDGSSYLTKAGNLAGLQDVAVARNTLGLGTAAIRNTGTAANNVVQLDATAKLPAVDGSALTGLSTASGLTSGTAANNLVRLDANAKLPAVDGSALTNLPASAPVAGAGISVSGTTVSINTNNTLGVGAYALAVRTLFDTPSGGTVAGSNLTTVGITNSGAAWNTGVVLTGTWRNVSGVGTLNPNAVLYQRVA